MQLEHFNAPGTSARLAAAAADRAARGFGNNDSDASGGLPDADLVSFEFGLFQRLLLEAALLGVALRRAEDVIQDRHGYPLMARAEREAVAAAESDA
jgi:hypothetical protein